MAACGPKPNTTVRCGAWPEGRCLPGFSLRVRNSPRQASPLGPADPGEVANLNTTSALPPARRRALGCRGELRRREAQGLWLRAYSRASCSDSLHLFDHSERSERRKLCNGPQDRASQGTRAKRGRAQAEPRQPSARRLACALSLAKAELRTRANDSKGQKANDRRSSRALEGCFILVLVTAGTASSSGSHHRRVTRHAGGGQACLVVLPQLWLLRAKEVEVVPGKNA